MKGSTLLASVAAALGLWLLVPHTAAVLDCACLQRAHAARTASGDDDSLAELTELPLDPWGRPYRYAAPGELDRRPHVFTLGADDAPGGQGADADFCSCRALGAEPTRSCPALGDR